MTLGEKLTKKRKEFNYTQEQLASLLGVSRQSISKWESDLAYPETDKLVRMSEMYQCSLDYLMKDEVEEENSEESEKRTNYHPYPFIYEKKSEKTLWGMPLWHIGKKARGVIAIGVNAKGIIAIGCKAQGIISVGVLSIGVISLGTLSLGLLALGMTAIGLLAAGCFSIGIVATGAICLGFLTLGAVCKGDFAIGALAFGKYFALGSHAFGDIAIGKTKAVGETFTKLGELGKQDIPLIKSILDEKVPFYLAWIKDIIKAFLGN